MSFTFTEGQKLAIESRGSSVLVSAAAGSGKTRVLTERLIRYVTDPETPVDIDRFLVITYTRAAAAELKKRIMDALGEAAAKHPEDKRLRRQQTLCCRAHIGTIHSFCTEVIRENCHYLGISPAFTVLDEERADAMKFSVLSRLLDKHYETIEEDGAFRLLADTVGAGRDDKRLESAVLTLYEKLRSHPYPEDWAAEQASALQCSHAADVGETVWGRELLSTAKAQARYWAEAMDGAVQEIYAADEKIAKAYGESFDATASSLRDFCRALDTGWDAARSFLPIAFPKLSGLRSYDNTALKDRVTAVRDNCKKAAAALQSDFAEDSSTLLCDLRAMAPAMDALLELMLEFDRAFTAEKNRRGVLDFSDLEHYAVRLLTDKASGAPTWIAAETSQRFQEIMVDEYQDVNAVQERIFRAVSRQERNLFLVGDVKQSIYRFRLADPTLFLDKYDHYAPAETAEDGAPRRILLQENFRSRSCILDAANAVFGNIMSKELGELDYDDAAALRFGAQDYVMDTDEAVELDLIDPQDSADDEETPEKSELEARFVARKILSMVRAGTPVYEKDGPRKCGFGDFVILMRAPGGKGGIFHRVLSEAGIPVQSQQDGGFFSSLEVTAAVNLLSLIDNPHADVPLISVLRSPVFGFSADELSAIRAISRGTDYYGAVCAAAEQGDGRCRAFLDQLGTWRALAPDLGLDALVWKICSDTGLFAICSAMSDGEQRRKNLMLLFEYARRFSESGYRGVFRFVTYLRRLAEKGAEPEVISAGKAVRIMSIHKSKGLEFPFVFLCDLAHQFNKSDARAAVLMHTALGLGPKYMDTERGIEYPTVARRAIEHRLTTEMLSEEMRVLYVGMTRAKERLIMTCVWKNAEQALEKLRAGSVHPIPPAALRAAPSPSRWLAMAALPEDTPLCVNIVRDADAPQADIAAEETAECNAGEAAYERIRAKLGFVYPFAGAAALPSKLTATELKGRPDDGDAEAKCIAPEEPRLEFRQAEPGGARALSAAERGTATHSFLQYVDFAKTGTEAELRTEAEHIAAAGHISREELAVIDFASVQKLFSSPLGRAMVGAKQLRREFRFTLLASAADYFDDAAADDQLLLQGIVDCFFVENGEITVVDYKTDRIAAGEVPARAEHYRGQLSAYAGALRRILGLPVRRCVLWFLRPGVEFEIKI